MTAAPAGELAAVSSEWVVSVTVSFHTAGAADVGCLALEDALTEQGALLRPQAVRLDGRRVRVAFGLMAASSRDAIADASAQLLARLLDVRPIPLWMPASLTAQLTPGLTTEGPR